jgi:hypothetical protein
MFRSHFGLRMTAAAAALMLLATASSGQERAFSNKMFRHTHFFLIWNETNASPRITLESLIVGKYADGLEYKVISAESKPLAADELRPGAKVEITNLPPGPRYLLMAEPGYNGVVLSVDRPYGIVASREHPLGLNVPGGYLYFYVPPKCENFRVVARCQSPHEGARIVVHRPDGSAAGELKGELDEETTLRLDVPATCRDAVWSLEFLPPDAPNTFLDDVSLFLEGDLPLLLLPQRDWAAKIGKETWRMDR